MTCLDVTLPGVAENLALDEALVIEAESSSGSYAVVLGASCRVSQDVLLDACATDGVPVLRRSSGGGTVVVGPGALNVTMILPDSAAPGLSSVDVAQRYVLERIVASIRGAGQAVSVLGRGDLVIGDRKCGGSAQRRLKHWFMVHCSILYQFAIERIVRYLAMPERQAAYRRGRVHQDFLSNLPLSRKVLVDAIRPTGVPLGVGLREAPRGLSATMSSLMAEKYGNHAWIHRFP
jgi:lipoate-protein ligase A